MIVFGWTVEKGHGLTWEPFGINGGQADLLLLWNEPLLRAQLARRDPGLIVLAYGTNEASDPLWHTESYRDMFARLVTRLRAMAPTASILVIGPDDRWAVTGGRRRPHPGIEGIIADQREVCRQLGCAYWDLRARMGGSGSMLDWVYGGFAQPDYVHFNVAGYRRLGAVLFGDLMRQFEAYRQARLSKDQNP